MSERETMTMLVYHECVHQVKEGNSLEDNLRSAFKAAQNHWTVMDEDTQMMGAVLAVHQASSPEDQKRLKAEIDFFKALNAATSGIPVDMPSVLDRTKDVEPVGINKIWREVKKDEA
jgi:hypothetical protein